MCTSLVNSIWNLVLPAFVPVALFALFAGILRNGNPLAIAIGADGRLSLSKLQFFVWTSVVLFCYALLTLYRAKFWFHPGCIIDAASQTGAVDLPQNVWIVLGISSGTMISAKAITTSQISRKQITKQKIDDRFSLADLFYDDSTGAPSLVRVQMAIWTIVAACIYVTSAFASITAQQALYAQFAAKFGAGAASLYPLPPLSVLQDWLSTHPGLQFVVSVPNVDAVLLVLMGLSSGTYVANKLIVVQPGGQQPAVSSQPAALVPATNGASNDGGPQQPVPATPSGT